MSKLQSVRNSLAGNPAAVVVGEKTEYNKLQHDSFVHFPDDPVDNVHLFVAPKDAIYDADALNVFMRERLLPDHRDYSISSSRLFESGGRQMWGIGILHYQETVGEMHRTTRYAVRVSDEELVGRPGLTDGVKKVDEEATTELKRAIAVRVFPSVPVARTVLDQKAFLSNCIEWDTIEAIRASSLAAA